MSSLPPQGPPPAGPEHLSSPGGAPLEPDRPRRGRRTALLAGTGLVVVGLVGGGAWAATSFFGVGAQPAEALPASALAYASINLDPSGEQKVEALRTLRKFPDFRERVGLETDDDLRRFFFEKAQAEGTCEDVDYDADIEPWLGSRAAVAAVPGADGPAPVLVLEVTDPDAAEDGMSTLRDCGGDTSGGWVVEGDWALVAETEEAAADGARAAGDGTLADDADFTRWVEEVGDPGVVSMYAAPAVGDLLLEELGRIPESPFGGELPEQTRRQLEDFPGAAATVRFDDGGVELELAAGGDTESTIRPFDSDAGADAVQTLPADTAAAFGLGFREGWGQAYLDSLEGGFGSLAEGMFGASFDELVGQAEQASGLELPEDAETLLGDSFALAVGGDLDLEAAEQSTDGSDVPVGAKVLGDGEEITRVLDALDEAFGIGEVVGHDVDGDAVAVGPSADYREQLLAEGDLGGTEKFESVVREADAAAAVLFVDLDADWVTQLAETESDDEVVRNLEPLSAFGMSAWIEDDVVHAAVRVDTD